MIISFIIKFSEVLSWQKHPLTIRHGNLEVPNILAKLPESFSRPSHHRLYEERHQKVKTTPTKRAPNWHHNRKNWPFGKTQQSRYKEFYPKETTALSTTRSPRLDISAVNQPTIEKIDWAQYSRMRAIEQINKSPNKEYKTAFSPSIHVMDGDDQMVTRVQGVGLVVKKKNRNRYEGKKMGHRSMIQAT